MRVTVLLGGATEERDVSLGSGCEVARALRDAGHDVIAVDTVRGRLTREEEEALLARGVPDAPPGQGEVDRLAAGDLSLLTDDAEVADSDVFFPALHGGAGEDGTIQTLLQAAGFAFVGSGPVGCALSMDKDLSKRLLRDAGVLTPAWVIDPPNADAVMSELGLPVILKPVLGGSSVGLALVRERGELEAGLREASGWAEPVMCEAFVAGRELTVGVVGDTAFPVGEIIPEHELFDYECKYQPGMAQEIFPADLDPATASEVSHAALEVHRGLRLRDFSRVDFMLDGDGRPWCLEANAIPGMTSASLLPKAARAGGVSFPDLVDRLVRLAAGRDSRGSVPGPGSASAHPADPPSGGRNPVLGEGVPAVGPPSPEDGSAPG